MVLIEARWRMFSFFQWLLFSRIIPSSLIVDVKIVVVVQLVIVFIVLVSGM